MTEIWLRIEAFLDILSTRGVLIEVGALTLCVCFGGLVAVVLRRRARKRPGPPMALSWEHFLSLIHI